MQKIKIIFLGTSEFAVPSLKILLDNKFEIKAVVTVPDKPQGRGRKVLPSPIKKFAIEKGIPILQPENLKNKEFIKQLDSYKADLQVVVAFRMLPKEIWDMPKLGTINLHASLLPQYRGAAPINWCIINGEKETGVTTFFLDDKMDTGEIVFMDHEKIEPDDNAGTLYERLKKRGSLLVLKTVNAIQENNYSKKIQPKIEKSLLKKAPKIQKEDCEINWKDNAENINNFIRGLSPIPSAWTILKNKKFKIFKIKIYKDLIQKLSPGEIFIKNKSELYVGTQSYPVSIIEFQPEGKRRMLVKEFLQGNSF